MSLINGASLQDYCNMEGFNVQCPRFGGKARIGILSNNQNDCDSCDSVIGFGIEMKTRKWSSGNIHYVRRKYGREGRDIKVKTFGYIFVQ